MNENHNAHLAALPRKHVAASCLIRDSVGGVLIVAPTYKENWELPGGGVEAHESPAAACRREVREELGLDRTPGRMLVVDWVGGPAIQDSPDRLLIVFDGGILSSADAAAIMLPPDELSDWAFVAPSDLDARVTARMRRRIVHCLEAIATGATLTLEDGRTGGPSAQSSGVDSDR